MVTAPTDIVAQSTAAAAGGSGAAKVEAGSPTLSFATLSIDDDDDGALVRTDSEGEGAAPPALQPTAGFG